MAQEKGAPARCRRFTFPNLWRYPDATWVGKRVGLFTLVCNYSETMAYECVWHIYIYIYKLQIYHRYITDISQIY